MTDILTSYISSGILNILMLFFLLYSVSKNVTMSVVEAKSYIVTVLLTITVIAAEMATSAFDILGNNFRIHNIISNVIGFTISVYIPFVLATLYNKGLIKKLKCILIPAVVNTVLFIASIWTGWMFDVTSNNIYTRGPYFPFYIFVYLYGFSILVCANRKLSSQFVGVDKVYLTLLYLIFIVGSFIQICFPKIHSSWHSITIVLVMYYIFHRERQFKYDAVTGLLNRSAFEIKLKKLSKNDYAVVIVFDLNKFKNINDTYGHQAGDDCIKIAGNVIKSSFQQIGNCYRIGGDEFCVLGQCNDERVISTCIKSMRSLLAKKRKRLPILPNISYGYSVYKKAKCKDISLTFNEADKKMYEYKMFTQIYED